MLLLSGHSLTAARKVPLEAFSLHLNERESTATITPADMTGITANSWMQDDTEPGKGIVWRVRSIRQAYGNDTYTVQLEHAISTLKDKILFGEVKTATMAGRAGATTCTAEQAVRYILKQQSDWALGTMAFSVSNPYKFDGESLFDALETVANSLDGCWWTYDFSAYPFKINFTKKSTAIGTVLRAGRNMTALTKTIDRSGMYTRHYPIGKNDLKLDGGGYVEKNTAAYGVISKVETDQTIDTKAELKRWSTERLNRHAEPVVTIEVEGFELSEQTGESMDKLRLGRMCYVPLAEFDTEILETITALQYPDKLFKPEVFKATLANTKRDVTKILSEALKSGGKGGRAAAKKDKEDFAWFEDTNNHVAMCAKGIVGVDAKGNPNWTRLSQIYVDGNGISQTVETVKKGQSEMKSTIDQHEDYIKQTVEAVGKDGKITAASICVAIEKGGSAARISADHIILTGTTTINNVMTVASGRVYIKKPLRVEGDAMMQSLTLRGGSGSMTLTDAKLLPVVNAVRISGPSNNQYTLQFKTLSNSNWADAGTFSRAVTQWGRLWSGGRFTATAQPQGQSCWTSIQMGDPSWSGRTVTIPINAVTDENPGDVEYTGRSVSATFTASKSDISMTRTRKTSEPSTDASLTWISSNGWYQFDVTACGVTKTYKVEVDVS